MHKPELASIIEKNFVIVEVDVGREDKNLDLAEQYHVPISTESLPWRYLTHTGIFYTRWTRGNSPTPAT